MLVGAQHCGDGILGALLVTTGICTTANARKHILGSGRARIEEMLVDCGGCVGDGGFAGALVLVLLVVPHLKCYCCGCCSLDCLVALSRCWCVFEWSGLGWVGLVDSVGRSVGRSVLELVVYICWHPCVSLT